MADEFQSILPPNATPWERAVEQTSGERWDEIPVHLIRDFKDPWKCPAHLLNFLAFERSVDIWDENWGELKKRSVIASAPSDHRMKGTEAGIRRYLSIADADLIQVVTPPQGFAVTRNLTKSEQDASIAKHPKVRITLAQGRGAWDRPSGIFVGASPVGVHAVRANRGRALYGRRAFLVREGVSTPLQLSAVRSVEEQRAGVALERVVTPGKAGRGVIVARSPVGFGYVGVSNVRPEYFTFALDRSYLHSSSRLALTTVPVGFQPRDTRYYRESERGLLNGRMHVGGVVGYCAVGRDRGGELLADVLYLHDPAVAAPRVRGRSFVGFSRISMQPHTAELLVDWRKTLKDRSAVVVGRSALGRDPIGKSDLQRRRLLLDAVASSKRLSDKITVSFQTTRPMTLGGGIPLDGSVRLGDRIPNHL